MSQCHHLLLFELRFCSRSVDEDDRFQSSRLLAVPAQSLRYFGHRHGSRLGNNQLPYGRNSVISLSYAQYYWFNLFFPFILERFIPFVRFCRIILRFFWFNSGTKIVKMINYHLKFNCCSVRSWVDSIIISFSKVQPS
jgi:hypothetical protein